MPCSRWPARRRSGTPRRWVRPSTGPATRTHRDPGWARPPAVASRRARAARVSWAPRQARRAAAAAVASSWAASRARPTEPRSPGGQSGAARHGVADRRAATGRDAGGSSVQDGQGRPSAMGGGAVPPVWGGHVTCRTGCSAVAESPWMIPHRPTPSVRRRQRRVSRRRSRAREAPRSARPDRPRHRPRCPRSVRRRPPAGRSRAPR